MQTIEKVYETGLLYHHYANTAYPLTPGSFMEYKVREPSAIRKLLEQDWGKIADYCLYIHVPFCQSRCRFREYTVFENPGEEIENEYVDLLLKEMQMYAPLTGNKAVIGFDIGGGTPLKLSIENIERIPRSKARLSSNQHGDPDCFTSFIGGVRTRRRTSYL